MVKLSKLGINGRMWGWIFSFMSDHTYRIWELTGGQCDACTGLPQGRVISPLLSNSFIMDMFQEITRDHTKIADDGTLWHIWKDKAILKKVSEDVEKI